MVNSGGVLRVNVGCGATPTAGWLNLDNSPSLLIPRWAVEWLCQRRFIDPMQARIAVIGHERGVRRARATKIPVADGGAEVVYSSHMLEHLTRHDADRFLLEAHRVLRPGGILRLVVPDIRIYVDEYLAKGEADVFVERLRLANERSSLKGFLVGFRDHRWMYDAASLTAIVERAGFIDVVQLPSGQTRIEDPDGLDLREREGDSLYLEARRGGLHSG